jgi:hypothetical protein
VWPGTGSGQEHNNQGTQHPKIFGRKHISLASENKKDAGLMCPRPAPWSWLKLLDVTRPLDKASLGYILCPVPTLDSNKHGPRDAWTARRVSVAPTKWNHLSLTETQFITTSLPFAAGLIAYTALVFGLYKNNPSWSIIIPQGTHTVKNS